MNLLVHISLLMQSSLFSLTPQSYNLTDKFYSKHVLFTYWSLPFRVPGEASSVICQHLLPDTHTPENKRHLINICYLDIHQQMNG